MAAHIRQILAGLSISVSDFKKSPKTVVKAAKNDTIAVIVNNKPAFYCVPADILESLYQKFYEINEISLQNMAGLDQNMPPCAPHDADVGFGANDVFENIEDQQDQACGLPNSSLLDPLSDRVSDPLDEEVAHQMTQSLHMHFNELHHDPVGAQESMILNDPMSDGNSEPLIDRHFEDTIPDPDPVKSDMPSIESNEEDLETESSVTLTDSDLQTCNKEALQKALDAVQRDVWEGAELLHPIPGMKKGAAAPGESAKGRKKPVARKAVKAKTPAKTLAQSGTATVEAAAAGRASSVAASASADASAAVASAAAVRTKAKSAGTKTKKAAGADADKDAQTGGKSAAKRKSAKKTGASATGGAKKRSSKSSGSAKAD